MLFRSADYPIAYAKELEMEVAWQTPKLLTLIDKSYEFRGGAHGMSYTFYYNFDLKQNKQLLFSDIIAADKTAEVRKLVLDELCNYFDVPNIDTLYTGYLMLDSNQDTPNTFPVEQANIGLTEKGVVFQFQHYQIACYAAGMPEATLPYAQIKEALTHEVKELLGEKILDGK